MTLILIWIIRYLFISYAFERIKIYDKLIVITSSKYLKFLCAAVRWFPVIPTWHNKNILYINSVMCDWKMADLNKELNEYLLSSKNEKQFKISMPSMGLSKPNIGKWLGKNVEEEEETTGWFRETQKDCCPTMVCNFIAINSLYFWSNLTLQTRMQRLTAFGACFLMGILCFCLSAMYIPVLLLKARKFALLYSLGSLFFLMRFVKSATLK